jgi:hypothetical protein
MGKEKDEGEGEERVPTSAPFSTTQTRISFPSFTLNCLALIAADNPAGPCIIFYYKLLLEWFAAYIRGRCMHGNMQENMH